MAVDPRNFLLNTDYEMDKIIYFTDGSITGDETTKTINHGLGFAPLIFGTCSTSSNFSDPRTIPYLYQTQSNTISFSAKADSQKITIEFYNFETPSMRMYYRIYAFAPDNVTSTIAPTASHANKFILNTDYNYCKLCKKGTTSGSSNTSVSHGLGYIPQVLAWREQNGEITPNEDNYWNDPLFGTPFGIAVGTSTVDFKFANYSYNKIHYRIYYDEN